MDELFERIIFDAIKKGATDIHLQSKEKGMIQMRIYGQLEMYECIEQDKMKKLINYIRFLSKIDLNYHLKPQTGHLIYNLQNKRYNLRISNLVGKDNETLVIRILNNHSDISIDNLSCLAEITSFLKEIAQNEHGLFVISGATGSGKSTTLYALIDEIYKRYHKNIITIEDPIEIDKNYCLQIELNEKQGITYEDSLKQILRHDPDIIMIGEIRDEKTASLALTCSLTGHLVLTTIHASNCINTLKRLLNLGLTQLDLEDVLIGVMTQKIKYNENRKLIVVSEYMNQEDIFQYLQKHTVQYFDFHHAFLKLKEQGIDYEDK